MPSVSRKVCLPEDITGVLGSSCFPVLAAAVTKMRYYQFYSSKWAYAYTLVQYLK